MIDEESYMECTLDVSFLSWGSLPDAGQQKGRPGRLLFIGWLDDE